MYFALLLDFFTVDELCDQTPPADPDAEFCSKFALKVRWKGAGSPVEKEWYPSCLAPTEMCNYHIKRLRLEAHPKVRTVFSHGLQSWQQLHAHLFGWYSFYSKARYVVFSVCIHSEFSVYSVYNNKPFRFTPLEQFELSSDRQRRIDELGHSLSEVVPTPLRTHHKKFHSHFTRECSREVLKLYFNSSRAPCAHRNGQLGVETAFRQLNRYAVFESYTIISKPTLNASQTHTDCKQTQTVQKIKTKTCK